MNNKQFWGTVLATNRRQHEEYMEKKKQESLADAASETVKHWMLKDVQRDNGMANDDTN